MLRAVLTSAGRLSSVRERDLTGSRHFFRWLLIVFNRIDKDRAKLVGADRACAEWLLRNGASVKWLGAKDYLRDYNSLPGTSERLLISSIDATDSAIHHYGFQHFYGCEHIRKIRLARCLNIENEALSMLSILKASLKELEVVECKSVTDEGLMHLKNLTHLSNLGLGGMPYVKDKSNVISELTSALPNCKIIYN